MSADLDPRAELTDRLAALGRRPVDPAVQSEHLTAIAGVASGSVFRASLAGRLKVAAGVMAGVLIGATGLTTAGAMGPLQPIAAKAVESVAPLDIPQGRADEAKAKAAKAAKAAKDVDGKGSIGTARDWSDGCVPASGDGEPATFAGNRGQYLKQERAKSAEALAVAKASTCGQPLSADDDEIEGPELDETDDGADPEDNTRKGADVDNDAQGDDAAAETEPGTPSEPGKGSDADKGGRPSDADAGKKPGRAPVRPKEKAGDGAGAEGGESDDARDVGDDAAQPNDSDV